jgi:hypothetical protein
MRTNATLAVEVVGQHCGPGATGSCLELYTGARFLAVLVTAVTELPGTHVSTRSLLSNVAEVHWAS